MLTHIETTEADRMTPPCPYFGTCGGCSLQHVSTEFYRNWKIGEVKNALDRSGVTPEKWEEPVFLGHATRRRTTLAAVKASGRVIFGYNEARSHKILNIERCLVLEPELDAKVQAIRPYLMRLLPDNKTCDITLQHINGVFDMVLTGPWMKDKFTYEQDEAIAELAEKLDIARISFRLKEFRTPEIILARKSVVKKFGNILVELPPATFLQASAVGEKALSDVVVRHAENSKSIVDLFSGCGTFTGALASSSSVTAIDSDAAAIAALQKAITGQKNITVARRNLFKNPLTIKELGDFDAAVFDPPRAGASEQAATLAASKIPVVIGISCNPLTFARDAEILACGGYSLKSVTVIDQFVWSAHVEVVGIFTK